MNCFLLSLLQLLLPVVVVVGLLLVASAVPVSSFSPPMFSNTHYLSSSSSSPSSSSSLVAATAAATSRLSILTLRSSKISSKRCISSSSSNEIDNDIDNDTDNDTDNTTTTDTAIMDHHQQQQQRQQHRSTLTLLEHVNLNVPNHEYILDFYFEVLGCGLDPRIAINLINKNNNTTTTTTNKKNRFSIEEGLVWPNMGASQFHLPLVRTETAQAIPGHIGLRYKSLTGLKERLVVAAAAAAATTTTGQENAEEEAETNSTTPNNNNKKGCCFTSYHIQESTDEATGKKKECVIINDRYGNTFHCRAGPGKLLDFKQPILQMNDQTVKKLGVEIAQKYALPQQDDDNESETETECRGLDYVEFHCPPGTATAIAEFYESVFDATTTVLVDEKEESVTVALIAFGLIDERGRAEQYLIFREINDTTTTIIPEYDGHHIALYVGTTKQDFEQAFKNADVADVVWVNPRFVDKVTTLSCAMSFNQFRFKDIINIKTGQPIFQLEHEIRSVEHSMWPGQKKEKVEKEKT